MLKVRLKRVGRKNDPSFRLILTESTNGPKSGKAIEVFGSYNPHSAQDNVKINGERILYWIGKGAQVSPTVHNMLVNNKIVIGKKVNVLPKKRPIVKGAEKMPQGGPKETSVAAVPAEPSSTPAA